MGDKSSISWTDASWNAVRGCTRVDEDCKNCYAERLASTRLNYSGGPYEGVAVTTKAGEPHWTGDIKLVEHLLDQPLRWSGKPRKIFVASMSDPFHPNVPVEWIARMWAVMSLSKANGHVFQLLTKRPERMYEVVTAPEFYASILDAARPFRARDKRLNSIPISNPAVAPETHIGLGTSVGSNKAFQRCVDLACIPAGFRFLSVEPMHGPVDQVPIESIVADGTSGWVITGGESGPHYRPFDPRWAEDVRLRCAASGIAFYHKQGSGPHAAMDTLLNGVEYHAYPRQLEMAGVRG